MTTTVNFLPWRHTRRQRCLRFWGLCCTGSVLSVALAILCLRADMSATTMAQHLRQQADNLLATALDLRQMQWKAQQPVQAQRQARQRQRAMTQRWQQALSDIAAALPEQAWLTQLTVEQQVMTLTGRANTFAALKAVNDALHALPGFRAGTPGKTGRDEQGHWQFSYQLIREAEDDNQP